ncbi:MAG TPA: hypothetical protein VF303_01925 [Candidatus Nanoarchaeia archaeon]
MKILLSCLIIILMGLSGAAVQAKDHLVLYDHFHSEFLDATKWSGSQTISGATILEYVREIRGGRLQLSNRAFGNRSSDSGRSIGTLRLCSAAFPGEFTTTRASVKVEDVEVTGCPSNSTPTSAFAELLGFFFNTFGPPYNGVQNNVLGLVQIRRLSNSTDKPCILEVMGGFVHCTDPDCLTWDVASVKKLGNVKLRESVTIQVEWDQHNEEFIFKLDKEPPQFISYSSYGWTIYPPSFRQACLQAKNQIANCTAERQMGFVDADFDGVFINEGAVP